MQVGGIGNSGLDNHSSSHQVTGCMHEHHTEREKTGAMRASSFASSDTIQKATNDVRMTPENSLLNTLKDAISKGLGFLGGLWSGGQENANQPTTSQIQVAGQLDHTTLQQADTHQPTVAAAASVVQSDARLSDNPYFTTTSDPGKTKENLVEKIRIKLRDMTGQLTKRFGERFGGRTSDNFVGQNALDSGQRKPQEDLRRRSRYKEEDMEIDCVLMDDSYLMDSYDRKGEYSKLTTDYKGQDKQPASSGGRKV